ncbi:NAD(P)/FAD-dependent oxidoreductase [Allobranchiibius huperziae]|uniref:NADPH-dependent 2,4-dienoyl-CoA reductase/sulfur reductase-like enzyme n=1 Tax=Allobranchiibius huperziae TaxID=1874116 RepID=A0A853DEY7_9MICO|nr:FAD-dependent oxidoreductase [Allobranchiibius huperziae]NYJ73624.1 NADPH-dependent 2,4-dienoyl-CoA reductase/sulfur reductase-like enzyme [Allobranchiibius huperziae]
MTVRRIVVVGNGIAGLTAADSLRAGGYDGDLTMVGDEPHAAYSRPALSKALLRDLDDLTSHQLAAAAHGATERLGIGLSALDPDRRLITLAGGEALEYDGLVIATGCRARRLGPADSGEVTLRSLDDALHLRERIVDRPTVIVVGGGPLGMEIASGCLGAGCEVTLVCRAAPLLAQLGEHLSGLFTAAATARGLRIVTSPGAGVRRSGSGSVVDLGDGRRLLADLVVTAVGDIPNTEWLASSGLVRSGAVHVDARGRVRPQIVAAGDVAAVPSRQGVRRMPLWNSAIDQAKVAAAGLLLGDEAPVLEHRPYFWTEQFGLSLKAVGDLPCKGEVTVLEGDSDRWPGEDPESYTALLRWERAGAAATVAAINCRIPIPRMRRLAIAA